MTQTDQPRQIPVGTLTGEDNASQPVVFIGEDVGKDPTMAKLRVLTQAIRARCHVTFDYVHEKGTVRRMVEPHRILYVAGDWHLVARHTDREEWRTYELSRMWSPTDMALSFPKREIPDSCQPAPPTAYTDHRRLFAVASPCILQRLIAAYGPDCCCLREDGLLNVEISYTQPEAVLSWVLSFGDRLRVVAPEDVVTQLRQLTTAMAAHYA